MALLDDIRTALSNGGLFGGATGWDCVLSREAASALDKVITVYETDGESPETQYSISYPHFQVRVRGAKDGYSAARAKIQAVLELLHANESVLGASYVYCYAVGSVMPLGYDANTRPILVQNFRVMKSGL